MEAIGLHQSKKDHCLFVDKDIIAVVYVDDILFFAREDSRINQVISSLKDAGVAIREEGTAEGFLGVDIKCSTDKNGQSNLTLLQTGLTKRIVEALGLNTNFSTKIATPAETSPLPKDALGEPVAGNINYAAVTGMLLYLSGHSRPDIAFAVHQCTRYTLVQHGERILRIEYCLQGSDPSCCTRQRTEQGCRSRV
jgi:hypothetical protein